MNEPTPTYTSRDDINVMPWYIKAGPDGLKKDAILVATMDGNNMLTISLHSVRSEAKDEL